MFDLKKRVLNWVEPWVKIPVVGFDISDRSVKYLKFGSDDGALVNFFGEFLVPDGVIVGGEIRREEEFVSVVEQWLSREGRGLRGSFVAASLPEEKSYLHLIQLPKVDKDKIGSAVRWEIEANIPLPPEELIYGQEVIEAPKDHFDHMDVVITAFPKNIVESYVRVLGRAGLTPVALELESQSIARAVISDLGQHTAEVIVDLGRTRTGIMVVSGNAIIFTKTVEFGGKIFGENIARALNVSTEKAELVKKEVGLSKKEYEGKVFSALIPACAALVDEIRRSIVYYQDRARHTHGVNPDIDTVLLVGGDANLRGIAAYFSSALKIKTALADPFSLLRKKSPYPVPPIPRSQALAFTTAIGLARFVN